VATILLVQNDPTLRGAWSRALRIRHHDVIGASDLDTAIGYAREGGVDVVVFDGSGREPDGRALVEELDRLPEPPPMILVSSSPRAPELSAHLGAATFVPKPCTGEDIVAECERLSSRRPRRVLVEDEPTDRVRREELERMRADRA
jgi:DNA-binding response OmpR family regulator